MGPFCKHLENIKTEVSYLDSVCVNYISIITIIKKTAILRGTCTHYPVYTNLILVRTIQAILESKNLFAVQLNN